MHLLRPTPEHIEQFLDRASRQAFSYEPVGGTRAAPPPGFHFNSAECSLGQGRGAFEQAKQALRRWAQFDTSWTQLLPPAAPLEVGTNVAVLARVWGIWSLNSARIVYTFDDPRSFGFAYGTLPGHAERGEERFEILWRDDDSVWYQVAAFFRPRHLLVRLAWPYLHRKVDQFREESGRAMQRAVFLAAHDDAAQQG